MSKRTTLAAALAAKATPWPRPTTWPRTDGPCVSDAPPRLDNDNDLLTLWLHAGNLSRTQVRDIIDALRETRVELARLEAEQPTVADLKAEVDDLEDQITSLEKRITAAQEVLQP